MSSQSNHTRKWCFFSYMPAYIRKQWEVGVTVYHLIYSGWTPENMYAKSRMCRCGDSQEQQSAKSLIITGGKCNVFWGCQCDCMQEGKGSARLNVAFCGCWQQRWRCAIKMCHSTLVWWLNKANRQCRKDRAEGRQERHKHRDGEGQKGLDTMETEVQRCAKVWWTLGV